MTNTEAAQHLVLALNIGPKVQEAYARGELYEVLMLAAYARDHYDAIKHYAAQQIEAEKKEVPAVERPLVRAWFPGQI